MAKRSKSEWRTLFEEHDASGLSAAEFCRQHGVDAKYFSLRKRQLTADSRASFIQVKPIISESVDPISEVSLRIIDVTVPLDCLTDTLTRLLARDS